MTCRIVVRLFAEVADHSSAKMLGKTAQAILAQFGNLVATDATRYWKVPEWFEVSIEFRPVAEPHSTFTEVVSSLGKGWQQFNTTTEERSAVWNPGPGTSFFSPLVRWANVELFPESALGSPGTIRS